MKPLNIKSERPSREELRAALYVTREGFPDGEDARVILRELLALQHGAEELAHKWRTLATASSLEEEWEIAHAYRSVANQLDKLMRGSPCA